MSSFLRSFSLRRTAVRVDLFDCNVKKGDASGSWVFSADGSWSSSGGGEPDDGVVGDGDPGSGGEFIVVADQEWASRKARLGGLSPGSMQSLQVRLYIP